jgi:hypothetical protein
MKKSFNKKTGQVSGSYNSLDKKNSHINKDSKTNLHQF